MSILAPEKEQTIFTAEEPSASFRVLNKVVRIVFPEKYPIFNSAQSLARYTDNVIDEGHSLEEAQGILGDQQKVVKAFNGYSSVYNPTSPVQKELVNIIHSIPTPLQKPFLQSYSELLRYFEDELRHRISLAPYQKEELSQHINGGYTAVSRLIKIILFESDLSNPSYICLTQIHGQAEPLADLSEDLTRGAVIHCREDNAEWVDLLKPQTEVPYEEIDRYVVKRRQPLSQAMARLAHSPINEFGGIFGVLHSLDYYHRAYSLSKLRFQPQKPVIFAQERIS